MNEEFKALEDKIDSKLESYRKEIHKLAQEPITSSLNDRDPPCGCGPIISCTKKPSPTFACASRVSPDIKGELQTLKITLNSVSFSLNLRYESRQRIRFACGVCFATPLNTDRRYHCRSNEYK